MEAELVLVDPHAVSVDLEGDVEATFRDGVLWKPGTPGRQAAAARHDARLDAGFVDDEPDSHRAPATADRRNLTGA